MLSNDKAVQGVETDTSKQPHGSDPSGLERAENRMGKRAALSGFFGSVIEFYDFTLYGTAAALWFGALFFPASSPTVGTLTALATFGVAYIARPAGAILFGHFGDKVGRKRVLQATVVLMGGSSALIGALPTYEMVGIAAPALLVLCRLAQGLSAGGEQIGASLLTMEHSSDKKRTLYTSWTPNGSVVGAALAAAVFIPITALPEEAQLSWGWRIPFLLSVITVAFVWVLRRGVAESPVFEGQDREEKHPEKAPLAVVIRDHPRALFTVFICAFIHMAAPLVSVFSLVVAERFSAIGKAEMLTAITLSGVVSLFAVPIWAVVSNHIGQKRLWVVGSLLCAVGAIVLLGTISYGSAALVILVTVLFKAVVFSCPLALSPVFYARQFPPQVRYTGVGLAQQSSYVILGFIPAICTALLGSGPLGWLPPAIFMCCMFVVAAIGGAWSRDFEQKDHVAPT